MSKHKSEDYKITAVKYYLENNTNYTKTCEIFKCSERSLKRWINRYIEYEEIIVKYSKGKITIISEPEKLEPEEEIVKDIMAIMNVYVAKINGLRKYKKQEKNKEKA